MEEKRGDRGKEEAREAEGGENERERVRKIGEGCDNVVWVECEDCVNETQTARVIM